jgi:hypothetical protein
MSSRKETVDKLTADRNRRWQPVSWREVSHPCLRDDLQNECGTHSRNFDNDIICMLKCRGGHFLHLDLVRSLVVNGFHRHSRLV